MCLSRRIILICQTSVSRLPSVSFVFASLRFRLYSPFSLPLSHSYNVTFNPLFGVLVPLFSFQRTTKCEKRRAGRKANDTIIMQYSGGSPLFLLQGWTCALLVDWEGEGGTLLQFLCTKLKDTEHDSDTPIDLYRLRDFGFDIHKNYDADTFDNHKYIHLYYVYLIRKDDD